MHGPFAVAPLSVYQSDMLFSLAAACRLPIAKGPCKLSETRWAFDSDQGKCIIFHYGGCKGNGNHFYTEKECKEYCGVPTGGKCTENGNVYELSISDTFYQLTCTKSSLTITEYIFVLIFWSTDVLLLSQKSEYTVTKAAMLTYIV